MCDEIKPNDIFINMINKQKQKEYDMNIWSDSLYKDIIKLQANNVGNVGETFIQNICDFTNIKANINGARTKTYGIGMV